MRNSLGYDQSRETTLNIVQPYLFRCWPCRVFLNSNNNNENDNNELVTYQFEIYLKLANSARRTKFYLIFVTLDSKNLAEHLVNSGPQFGKSLPFSKKNLLFSLYFHDRIQFAPKEIIKPKRPT